VPFVDFSERMDRYASILDKNMRSFIFLATMILATGFVERGQSPASAIYSYNLNGTKVSGGEVDATETNNTAWVTQDNKGKKVQFFLSDGYNENAGTFAHSLRFAIPAKTGSVAMKSDDDNWSVQLFVGAGSDGQYTMYGNDVFTITITGISSTRVAGTFSGKVKPLTGSGAGLNVTDGKFDIPLRTESH
jgi:hypothetical protein